MQKLLKLKISIIIPTLNRPSALKKLIQELIQYMDDEIELIIIDDSNESLSDEINSWSGQSVNYIHRGEKLGVSSARNVGADFAKGKYLIFLDDDDAVTSEWLSDFKESTETSADLTYCNMLLVDQNKKETIASASTNKRGVVIPGAWIIRKSIFEKVGGFDERLKFAENTELFFRLDQLALKIGYIEKVNFIYNQSVNGGSKNLQNMIDSILIILQKHDSYLTTHVKHLYHQIVGVNLMRFQNYPIARSHLWKAWIFKPYKMATLARLVISFLPLLARNLYKSEFRK
ncbi:glycosyltransferase family A protein [Algoriphagus sp. D3-2-R+10]|uniref:glycosyltransferase family 2 protein n=1 Tax=Algoriphagus aurantiacus TaxID=3103948 RepID=UPI002B3CD217|nr:glycosyltransferase family A protein [Algoriphagus sp. D3-2-R+10]MEB2778314.1 glycosyltransferase family A protein [Algoriphagus sp. D3-2-R+10]